MISFPVEAVLFVFLIAVGIAVARLRDLFAAAMLTGMFSLLSACLFRRAGREFDKDGLQKGFPVGTQPLSLRCHHVTVVLAVLERGLYDCHQR